MAKLTLTNTNAQVRMLSKIITDGDTLTTQLSEPAHFERVGDTYVLEYINIVVFLSIFYVLVLVNEIQLII